METAIQVVWWIGLLGALAATLVILNLAAMAIRTVSGIRQLAEIIRDASSGIAAHVDGEEALAGMEASAVRLRDAAREAAGSLERRAAAVPAARRGR